MNWLLFHFIPGASILALYYIVWPMAVGLRQIRRELQAMGLRGLWHGWQTRHERIAS